MSRYGAICVLIFCQSFRFLSAQDISIQQNNPTSLKWNQINTPHFRFIYPRGFDVQAQRMANTLELIREPEAASMGVKPKKISIILQNQSSISNAFVTLAPRRSEFYTMPPQNYNFAGTNDWLNLLASHEYRHIVQYQRSIVGFSKLIYYAFGQQALSIVSFAAAPQWFWEGDAVATETAFTRSGRGKIPEFDLLFRTNLLEGRTFNYHKQYLRSYKHNIPDHYVLGYHMIDYLRLKTGDAEIWEKIVRRSWSVPFIPFGFSRAIKKEAGMGVMSLYRQMADSLRYVWQARVDAAVMTKFQRVNERNSKAYTDYMFPQPLGTDSVAVMKSGIGEIAQVVVFAGSKEVKKFVIGPLNETGMLSVSKKRVVWNEYRYDPRWRVRTYSIVRGLDFATGKVHDLTKRSRYAGAALSPDGKSVATVESGNDYTVKLVILDFKSGKVVKAFENSGNEFISMPRWTQDGKSIVAVQLSGKGKKISRFDASSGTVTELMNAGNENVGNPMLFKNFLFYNSPYSSIDNIYAMDITSGRKFQVTSAKHGAYNPSVSADGEWIYYNEQTRDGMDVVKAALEPSLWIPIEQVKVPQQNLYQTLVDQEGHPNLLDNVPTTQYPVTKYSKWRSTINPHSWGPFFNTTLTQASIGISSRDLLGNTVIDAGYQFDINERTGTYSAGVSYQGLFPVLDLSVTRASRTYKTSLSDENGINNVKFTWKEDGILGGFRIPLLLTRSKFNSSLTLSNAVGITRVTDFNSEVTRNGVLFDSRDDRFVKLALRQGDSVRTFYYGLNDQVGNGYLRYDHANLSFSHYLKLSRRDINPKWGVLLNADYYATPFGGDYKGSLAAARGLLYFPGLFKHHSLSFRGGYQWSPSNFELNRYTFRNSVYRPRGFRYSNDNEFWMGSANYAMPLWYPDIAIGPLVNIQRVRTNLFFDYGRSASTYYFIGQSGVFHSESSSIYSSVGAEFTFDLNLMRLLPQFDLGFRVSHGISQKEDLTFEILIGSLNL